MPQKQPIFESPFESYKTTKVLGEGGAGRVYAAEKYQDIHEIPAKNTRAKYQDIHNEIPGHPSKYQDIHYVQANTNKYQSNKYHQIPRHP